MKRGLKKGVPIRDRIADVGAGFWARSRQRALVRLKNEHLKQHRQLRRMFLYRGKDCREAKYLASRKLAIEYPGEYERLYNEEKDKLRVELKLSKKGAGK